MGPMGPRWPIGPIEPMGPGAQQDQWGPMAPLANRISTATPKSTGRGGSLAYTLLLARVELNLSLLASTPTSQQEAIPIATSTSVLGIANSVFDGHACVVHLKKNNCNALPVPLAKTGFFLVFWGVKNRSQKWYQKGLPKWTPNGPQNGPQGHQKASKSGVSKWVSKRVPFWEGQK